MQLQIIGIDQKNEFRIQWVELQTVVGNFIIQPHHAPMIVEMQPKSQIRFCLDSSKQKTVEIAAGVAHITRTTVTILLDSGL